MASDSSNVDAPSPEEEVKEENVKCFRLFNCDQTYKFDAVGKLLEVIKAKLSFDISIQEHNFDLRNMSDICDRINKKELQMDFAIFVVHAHESRLSINEDNAGIGYAKLYRALLQATEERVLIVIGGDDNYKDSAEEQSTVLSRWARRKVSSQFNDEFLDGRKSFIFSWDNEHRPIHEEAMLHFFDKKGETFVPKPKVEATVALEDPKTVESQERSKTDVQATKTEENFPANQTQKYEAQKTESRREQEEVSMQHPFQTDETELHSLECLSMPPDEQQETEEPMDTSHNFVNVDHSDVLKEGTLTQPDTGAPSLPESIAILYQDKSDIDTIKDVFGDVLQSIAPIKSNKPSDMKDLLPNQPVRSCFIVVEATKMREELQKKSHTNPYTDLLKTARCTVEKKVVVILCNKGSDISSSEENAITARIEELLGEKGFILWLKGSKSCLQTKRPSLSRSESCPVYEGAAKKSAKKGSPTQVARPTNPEELVLYTRLRHGKISHDQNDVIVWREGWTAHQKMTDDLFKDFHSFVNTDVRVFREIETGNERTVVNKDFTSQLIGLGHSFKGALEGVVRKNAVESGVDGASNIGSSIGLCESSNTSPPNNDAPPSKSETDTQSSNDDTDDLQVD